MRKTVRDAAPYSSYPPWRSDGPLLLCCPTFPGAHQPRAGAMASTISETRKFSPSS